MNDDRTIRDRLADSQTQEKVREAVADLANALASPSMQTVLQSFEGLEEGRPPIPATVVETEHLRTLLAAYTRMETDMAEARRLMEPFEEISTRYPREPDHANVEMFVGLAPFRALAAFYNKGEE